jgi:eukaryotic-like serine/threonine-protein kinase
MTHVQLNALQPGMLLGDRYKLEREVGRGGMAVVWLATDQKLNREVAIKVLLGELAFAMGPERFKREIEVVSRLSHPHILPIDDYGEYEGQLYYVMPFIAGETIHKRLERERQLPVQDAVRIAYEVAMALEHAHRNGIVHRDIKPENVLLQNGEALVADFGIARAITEGGGPRLTSTGVTLGTPTYMSPEQAMADPSIDGRSDVYSLGCVLYEMLAGQPPFSGPTAQAIIARHQLDEAPSLSIVRGTIPEEVEDIVMQALAKLPADRFATAGEMAEELRKIMTTGARPARVSERRKRTTRTTQRRRRGEPQSSWKKYAIIAAVVVPVLGAGGWAATHFLGKGAVKSRIGTDSDPNHIAVLYFDDLSDGKLRALSDGLTESLIDELGAVKQLTVISRNGVAPFKGKNLPTDSVQRTIVSGSVAQSGDQLRVKVELVDAANGRQIASETFDKPRSDLFALQDTLAKEVSRALRKQLGNEVDNLISRPGTSNAQAWEALQQVKLTIASLDSVLATSGPQQALQQVGSTDAELARISGLDSKWAAPIVLRGENNIWRVSRLATGDSLQKWIDAGLKDADQALALEPNDPDALDLRGTLRYFKWSYNLAPDPAHPRKMLEDAAADLQKAVDLNPLQTSALNSLSFVLNSMNRFSDAKVAAERAYVSDPYLKDINKTIWRLAQNSLMMGIKAESQKWCDIGAQRFPRDFRFAQCRLLLFGLPGQKVSADTVWKTYQQFVDLGPPSRKLFNQRKGAMFVALDLLRAGVSPDSARHVADRASSTGQTDDSVGELLVYEAQFRAQVGDTDKAIRLLSKFFAVDPPPRAFAKDDDSWYWEPIRNDPRYKALVGGTT